MKKEEKNEVTNNNTIITSRVLFVSVFDKIMWVVLSIYLGLGSISILLVGCNSFTYNLGTRIMEEIGLLISFVLLYLLYNWIYKCLIKTMLCLTKNEVYIEKYMPLVRHESTIPLNKITAVTAHKFIWIFRAIVIHQYHRLPVVFWTWTNQDFKDELDKLITGRNLEDKPINDNKDKDIVPKDKIKMVLIIVGAALAAMIVLASIISGFVKLIDPAKNVPGTYSYKDYEVVLKKDGNCDIDDIITNTVTSCTWSYNHTTNQVIVDYKYKYKFGYSYYDSSNDIEFSFDKKDKSITYDGVSYKK